MPCHPSPHDGLTDREHIHTSQSSTVSKYSFVSLSWISSADSVEEGATARMTKK